MTACVARACNSRLSSSCNVRTVGLSRFNTPSSRPLAAINGTASPSAWPPRGPADSRPAAQGSARRLRGSQRPAQLGSPAHDAGGVNGQRLHRLRVRSPATAAVTSLLPPGPPGRKMPKCAPVTSKAICKIASSVLGKRRREEIKRSARPRWLLGLAVRAKLAHALPVGGFEKSPWQPGRQSSPSISSSRALKRRCSGR